MHTIVLATQKGGSGKTTLAVGLAVAATQQGHTVRLIETDSHGALSHWKRRRAQPEPRIEPVTSADEIEQRLEIFGRNGVTLTIIDTAGGVSAITTAAIRYADLVLIPARPSPLDIEATSSTLSLARAWRKPFAFVLNQTPIRGQRLGNAATTLGKDAGLDLCDILAQPFIVMRNDHQDAIGAGLAVTEFAPAGKSAEEIRDLWQWVEKKLDADAPAVERPSLKQLLRATPSLVPTMFLPISQPGASPASPAASVDAG
jgi:chromosome partitioning protein